jgi:UDP-glucose 4-epimerase
MSNKFNKVLVTGGAGCIGLPVCKELIRRGTKVVLFDLYEQINLIQEQINDKIDLFYGSILDESSLREAIRGCDGVIHLAAYLGVRRTELNSLRCLDININGTKKVLDVSINAGINKFVFASSSEVYGEPLKNPICEDDMTQGKTVYAVSKMAGEELIKAYHKEFKKMDFTILRYFNTYGPNQIAQFVIPKFIRNVLNDMSPVIYGNGKQVRSYSFSDDTARGTVDALFSHNADNMIINIGNSNDLISLIDLGELVIKLCGKQHMLKINIKNDFKETDRSGDREIYQRYCSTEKAKHLLGYDPKISLEEGINKVIKAGILLPKWATSERDYTLDDYY